MSWANSLTFDKELEWEQPVPPLPIRARSLGSRCLVDELGKRCSNLMDRNNYIGPYFCRDLGIKSGVS